EWVGPEYTQTLYEIIAYLCYTDYPIHLIFCLVGTGRNGKGVTQRLLETMLGTQNVCARKMDEIAKNQFAKADLYCKYANLSGEMRYEDIKDNTLIKELSGEDIITAERKFRDPFEFRNYTKLIFSTNNLPPSLDMNVGWLDRVIFFEFPKTFDSNNKNTDKNLLGDLKQEAEGLLIWSLKGLQRLLENKKFSNQPDYNTTGERWERSIDTVKTWFEDRLEITKDYTEKSNDYIDNFFKDYSEWCKTNMFSPESRISFGRKLQNYVYKLNDRFVHIGRKQSNGVDKKILYGVELKC
ncbi:MAG: phage/plasmid primase, P4 family, partial [Candidatus Thermoplasmatota archaeon]|nr:phage/plasmid primase, P4 family [Candidatus Thermoplasmatota archaeon]